jgi:hypothetical protein
MNRKRSSVLASVVTFVSAGCLISRGLAAQLTPVRPEVRADTLVTATPSCPLLAVGADEGMI